METLQYMFLSNIWIIHNPINSNRQLLNDNPSCQINYASPLITTTSPKQWNNFKVLN